MELRDRYRGALIGLACGDAVGATLEFKARGGFVPITDMIGGGVVGKAGEWTDDTAMALCLAHSLIEKGFDLSDQMQRYSNWLYDGYIQKNGQKWVGITTYNAIRKYKTANVVIAGPTDTMKAGNGSLMRLAPVPMFSYPDLSATVINSAQSSRTTHGSLACLESCMLYGEMIHKAFAGEKKEDILYKTITPVTHPEIIAVKNGTYKDKTEDQIEGSGYVVKSMEASLWSFLTTGNFRDAILKAANLGDDADTTAAITGQLAGAYYGHSSFPENWKKLLDRHDEIVTLADLLCGDKR